MAREAEAEAEAAAAAGEDPEEPRGRQEVDGEEAEDALQCRFCYQSQAAGEEPLIAPCECAGTVRFVHASCLNQWRMLNLDNDRRLRCQLCQAPFRLAHSAQDESDAGRSYASVAAWRRRLLSRRTLYEAALRACSGLTLLPLSCAALYVSRYVRRDDLYVHGPSTVYARPWLHRTFGNVLSKRILQDINLFIVGANPYKLSRVALVIYGLSKLGSYGCTFWLFTDGLADVMPARLPGMQGGPDARPSPALAVVRAVLEFYMFPFFLRTPQSRLKLPFFFFASGIGVAYIWARIHNRLRAFLLSNWPAYRELELGQLDTRILAR